MKRFITFLVVLAMLISPVNVTNAAALNPACVTADSDATDNSDATAEDTTSDEDLVPIEVAENVYVKGSQRVKDYFDNMDMMERIEQMIMPSYRVFDGENVSELKSDKIIEQIHKHNFAGITLFAENCKTTEQTVRLIDSLQTENQKENKNRPQYFIATDQEGGRVTRLGTGTQLTGNMGLAATGNTQNAVRAGEIIGEELSSIGINTNYGPVMDVNNNPANPVIGLRSFSDDPQMVSDYGVAYLQGLMDQNVIGTLKHFPGHGDTDVDSHTGFPIVDKSYDELMENELVPFKACIDAGAEMIMTAHIQYPQIEKEKIETLDNTEVTLPATMSKEIITNILRGKLGYEGVVVTDALNMDAIAKNFGRFQAASYAINAGVDILLWPVVVENEEDIEDFENYLEQLYYLVMNKIIDFQKINEAVVRILKLKDKKGLLSEYSSSDLEERVTEAKKNVGCKDHHSDEWKIARSAITMVKNDSVLPVDMNNQDKKVIILNHDSDYTLSAKFALDTLKNSGKMDKEADISETTFNDKEIDDIKPYIDDKDIVIIVNGTHNQAALSNENSAKVSDMIDYAHSLGSKVIYVSYSLPYDVARFQSADAILIAYSTRAMTEIPDFSSGEVVQYGPCVPAAIYKIFNPD
ncbi:MAG: hypothetical protein K6G11_10135, partial [Lachnospiraceae bacterium]|nr:hypothetical protein [Lachnospiraceae bacterium]